MLLINKRVYLSLLLCVAMSFYALADSDIPWSLQEKAYITENSQVKIVVPEDSRQLTCGEKGAILGFEHELLDMVAQKTGLHFEKHIFEWDASLASFNANQADAITGIFNTEDIVPNALFTDYYSEIPITVHVYTRKNFSDKVSVNTLMNKKVGIVKNIYFTNALLQLDIVPFKEFNSVKDMLADLHSGTIDIALHDLISSSSAESNQFYSDIVLFDQYVLPDVYAKLRIAINEDKPVLRQVIQKALNSLKQWELNWLKNKWLKETKWGQKIVLTDEESEWLKKNPEIALIGVSHNAPMISLNTDGTYSGILPEYLGMISKLIGSRVFIKDIAPPGKGLEYTTNDNRYYGVPVSFDTPQARHLYELTEPYFNSALNIYASFDDFYIIRKKEDLAGRKVALLHNHLKMSSYIEDVKNIEIISVSSPEEQFAMLSNREVDAIIGYPSYCNLISKLSVPNIMLAFSEKNGMTAHFAIDKKHHILTGILNKAIKALTPSRVEFIALSQSLEAQDTSLDKDHYGSFLTAEEQKYLDSKTTLRVSSLEKFAPFSFSSGGSPTGYSTEYMKLLGKHLGIEIEFVPDSWSNLLKKLQTGEIDVIPYTAKTSSRERYIDYSTVKHLAFTAGFAVRKSEHIESIDALNGKVIAVPNRSYLHEHLEKYHPEIQLLPVGSTQEAVDMVAKDRAFAAIGSLPSLNYFIQKDWLSNLKAQQVEDSDLPEKSELYMAVTKGNTLLLSILDKAVMSLPEEEARTLKRRWIDSETVPRNKFELTEKEERFISRHPVIRFRIRAGRPPFEYEENGKAAGLSVDYLKAISAKVGIKPEFVLYDGPISEQFKIVNGDRKQFDTLSYLPKSKDFLKQFNFGDAYLTYPMMIVANKDVSFISKTSDLEGKNVALEEGFMTNKWITRDFPGINIISAPSTIDALRMVNDGRADAYIGNLAIANYLITKGGMDNLKIAAPSAYGDIKYHLVAPKEWPELASVLSKGYQQLSVHDHSTLQQHWFSVQIVEKIDYALMWRILGGSVLFIIVVLWWNRTLAAQKRKTESALSELAEANSMLEVLAVTDSLTSLYNRVKLDTSLAEEFSKSKRYESLFSVIILDIDSFKVINDTFGHLAGDEALVNISSLLKEYSRESDIVGRWGGEEFIVICPQTDGENAKQLAERIRAGIEKYAFSHGRLTCSFGVTQNIKEDENIESIVARADRALYTSKQTGKNKVTLLSV